ncbi:ribonuclease H-like domain-containing protein [Umbelopsis sp. AD052]|nr:ribonuclease H-like domain-containing protein [Umbelopsis sp. AD052]
MHHGVKLVKPISKSVSCKDVDIIDAFIYSPSIPGSIKDDLTQPCVLGVDEAGRGPVLGPMVYSVCYCPLSKYEDLKALGFADSKTLKEDERDRLFEILETNADIARSSIHALSPQSISAGMLRGQKYNLNEMAHESTIGLIRGVLDLGVNITEIYVDTVGPPASYQAKLSRMFPGIDITVAKKADSTYPIVSAASIVAKVTRDAILKNWTFAEPNLSATIGQAFGSGYPSDPNTVRWLNENIDPVFGYPSIIRFSWSTTATILEKKAAPVEWPDTETKGTQKTLKKFVKEPETNSKLMQKVGLKAVAEFV